MIRAGQMDRQITIEKPTFVEGAFGPEPGPWEPLVPDGVGSPIVAKRFWAEVQDALPSRDEAVQQGKAVSRNLVRVRMRWRDDIDSSMRVTLHADGVDSVMQIVGGPAAIQGRKQFIEIMCERIKL